MGSRLVLLGVGGGASASTAPPAMPLISRDAGHGGAAIAVVSNEDFYFGARLADDDGKTAWQSVYKPTGGAPQWAGYDLSGVPSGQRAEVVINWCNQQADVLPGTPQLLAVDYTVQANAAAGGSVPGSGWVTLETITGNAKHGRQHLVDLTGYNWVRLHVTASAAGGGPGINDDLLFQQLNVHDAHLGHDDGILFLGDSITAACLQPFNAQGSAVWAEGHLAQIIHAALPVRFPAIENGGQGTQNMQWLVDNLDAVLDGFVGKYVAVMMGHNDANQSSALSAPTVATWYANLLSVIDTIQGLGKTPILAKLLWGDAQAAHAANAATLNGKVDDAMAARSGCIAGVDPYAFFQAHTDLLADHLHPTYTGTEGSGMLDGLVGYEHLLRLWSEAMVANVYG